MTIYDAWQVILSNQKTGALSKHMQAMVSAELKRLTVEIDRLDPKLQAMKTSKDEHKKVLEIMIEDEKNRNTAKLRDAEEALASASVPPVFNPPVLNQEPEAPPLPKEPVSLDVTLDEEDETAEMTHQEDSNVPG